MTIFNRVKKLWQQHRAVFTLIRNYCLKVYLLIIIGAAMFIDSHCHLNLLKLDAYEGDLSALIGQARSVGVEHILCVATDLENSKIVSDIACLDCIGVVNIHALLSFFLISLLLIV